MPGCRDAGPTSPGKLFLQPHWDLRFTASAGVWSCHTGSAEGDKVTAAEPNPQPKAEASLAGGIPWAEVAERASTSLRAASGMASPWESSQAPSRIPYASWDGSH